MDANSLYEPPKLESEWALTESNWPSQYLPELPQLYSMWVSLRTDLSKHSIDSMVTAGKRFCRFMEGRDLTPQTMLLWMRELQQSKNKYGGPLDPAKINKHNSYVRNFLKWLKLLRKIQADPSGILPRLRHNPPAPPNPFTDEEYEKMKAYCRNKPRFQPFLWLIIIGYRTGLSMVDCASLTWDEVVLRDDGPCFISRIRQKLRFRGERARCVIPILPGTDLHDWFLLLRSARNLKSTAPDGLDYVCPDAYFHFTRSAVRVSYPFRDIINGSLKPSKDPKHKRTFRNLRQSFCSNLINSGADAALVCRMTGHSNLEMLIRYVKPELTSLESALKKSYEYAAATHPLRVSAPPIQLQITQVSQQPTTPRPTTYDGDSYEI